MNPIFDDGFYYNYRIKSDGLGILNQFKDGEIRTCDSKISELINLKEKPESFNQKVFNLRVN